MSINYIQNEVSVHVVQNCAAHIDITRVRRRIPSSCLQLDVQVGVLR